MTPKYNKYSLKDPVAYRAFVAENGEIAWPVGDVQEAFCAIAKASYLLVGGEVWIVGESGADGSEPIEPTLHGLWNTNCLRADGEGWQAFCNRMAEDGARAVSELPLAAIQSDDHDRVRINVSLLTELEWQFRRNMPSIHLETTKICAAAQTFVKDLLAWRPDLAPRCRMRRSKEGMTLYMPMPSPTEDPDRYMGIWEDHPNGLSIGFGPWHSHSAEIYFGNSSTYRMIPLLDVVKLIMTDRIVFAVDKGSEHLWFEILDLRNEDDLLDLLTSPDSTGPFQVKSWSGKGDRLIELK